MNLLILGDIVGISGRNVVKNNLKSIIDAHNIDFVVANGENAADDGKGITKQVAEELFSFGIDVLTSGNHIWDKKDVIGYIDKNDRLLRPANFVAGSPGKGFGIYLSKKKNIKLELLI